jgi:hypothetical protein
VIGHGPEAFPIDLRVKEHQALEALSNGSLCAVPSLRLSLAASESFRWTRAGVSALDSRSHSLCRSSMVSTRSQAPTTSGVALLAR